MPVSSVLHYLLCPPQSLFKFVSIESMTLSNFLIVWHPLLLPSIFPRIRVFSSDSALHIRWPKYWRFSFNVSPSSEYSGLISSRIDWSFDLLAVSFWHIFHYSPFLPTAVVRPNSFSSPGMPRLSSSLWLCSPRLLCPRCPSSNISS